MRILYITDLDLSSRTAPPIHVSEIINNLSELKNEVFLIGPKSRKLKLKAQTKYLNLPKNNILRGIIFNLKLLFLLPPYIYKNKIQVIYTRQSATLVAPAIVAKIFSIPYITEVNGTIEEELQLNDNLKKFTKIAVKVENFCYKIAKKIIVVTPYIKKYLIKKYNIQSSKIISIENGVDTDLFTPKELKKEYDLIFVGNLASWQGLDFLIKSIPLLKPEKKDIKILIIGNGPEENRLKTITKKLKLEKNILFLGSKPHYKIPLYINQSKICIAPFSLNDRNKKTGISAFKIYEYASCGKPIITTNLKGVSEFINKNKCGLAVEPNNSRALAFAIIKILNEPKLAGEMGKNGRKTILHGYSWKNVAEKTREIIREVIRKTT